MRISKLQLHEGMKMPNGFGIAWFLPHSYQWVILPIPLNIIAAWFRDIYYRLAIWPNKLKVNRVLLCAYDHGWRKGNEGYKSKAYEIGLKAGFSAGEHCLKIARFLVNKNL